MLKQNNKKELVRCNIIENVQTYKNMLAGRYYLYIFENQSFEMYYGTENFLHLTGVGTKLSPNQFYELAKRGHLQTNQLFFNDRFPLSTALQKTKGLADMDKFVREGYFVIKDFVTDTAAYPYAITNIDQSILIGLKSEDLEEIYIPKSLRVKGNIFDKSHSENIFEIQAILSKTDKESLYDNVLYHEKNVLHNINENIKYKIKKELLE